MNRLAKLEKAFDNSANNSPLIHLSSEQASSFVDLVADESSILSKIRLVKMDRAKLDIGRILSNGRFLHGVSQDEEVSEAYKAKTDTITLTTTTVAGKIEIHDDEIKHNVEGAGIETTLLNHVAKKVRNELTELIFFAKKGGSFGAGMDAFTLFNGVFARIEGKNEVDFTAGFTDQFASNEKFRKMIKTMPVQFRSGAEFFLGNDVMIDYNAQFDGNYNRNDFVGKILSHTTNEIPGFMFDDDGQSKVLLTDPQNIILGIQVEDASMQFERERVAGKRKTVFHFSMEIDVALEIPEAAVVGNKIKSK